LKFKKKLKFYLKRHPNTTVIQSAN